jgi:hypothetical protein
MKTRFSPILVAALALALAACTAAGPSASTSPEPSVPPTEQPSSAPSEEPVSGEPGNGGGGGGGVDPNPGQPQLVEPVPGQLDVHPVAIEEMTYRIDGRHVVLNVTWWSGVEPCYILDSVVWEQDGPIINVSVREGHGPQDVMCIEIAVQKVTVVDLGELEPGDYSVVAIDGIAPPLTISVP